MRVSIFQRFISEQRTPVFTGVALSVFVRLIRKMPRDSLAVSSLENALIRPIGAVVLILVGLCSKATSVAQIAVISLRSVVKSSSGALVPVLPDLSASTWKTKVAVETISAHNGFFISTKRNRESPKSVSQDLRSCVPTGLVGFHELFISRC